MTKKPIIAIDVDDVLARSVEAFRLDVNRRAGVNLTPDHFRVEGEYYQYFDRVLEKNGIDYAAIKEIMIQDASKDQSHFKPHDGAVHTLEKLARNFDLIVVTARYPEWELQTHVWLERHFPGLFRDVHFAGNRKDPDLKTKGDMCQKAGASYLIDDNPEHARSAMDKGVEAILFGEYGWHVDVPDSMVRCKTWKDVERYFENAAPRH